MNRRAGAPTAPPGKILRNPGILRLLHWTHVLLTLLMALTGFYLDRPFLPPYVLRVSRVRLVHLTFASSLVASLLLYLVYLWSSGSWRDVVPGRPDWRAFGGTLRHELLLSDVMPMHGKYQILQKLLYLSFIPALLLQTVTGWALASHGTRSGALIISLSRGLQQVRLIHYFLALYLVVTATLHFYRVLAEPGLLTAMVTGWADAVPPVNTRAEGQLRPPGLR